MADIEAKLDYLESSLRLSNTAFQLVFAILNAKDQSNTISSSLAQLESTVKDLHDEYLLSLYQELLKNPRSGSPSPKIESSDFQAFLHRLSSLVYESAAKANEADIDLREMEQLPAESGIWGKRGWRHPAV